MKYLKRFESVNWKNNLYSLLEKRIEMGDDLKTKLSKISNNDTLAKKMLDFFNSDEIKDDAKIAKIDYDKEDGKLLTVIDENGKSRKFKFGKLLNYLGYDTNKVKPYEVENFLLNFTKAVTTNLREVTGKDILDSYNCKNYDKLEKVSGGSLEYSCMRFEQAQKYLGIYTSNPKQVSCLTLFNPDNNKIQGRALVWTLDNGKKYMDRVYALSKEITAQFINYADENNLQRSASDNVTLENKGDYDYYPYMDTFHYYTPDTGVLSTSEGEKQLLSTSGGATDGDSVWSDFMQENIASSESVYSQCMDSYIYQHDATEVISGVDKNGNVIARDWLIDDESVSAGGLAEAVTVSYTSPKFKELEDEKALIDICRELEGGDEYVFEDDDDIWTDDGWGALVKVDMLTRIEFDSYKSDGYGIKVTYENARNPEEYQPYSECCSVYNPEEERFDVIHEDDDWDDFFEEMYGDDSEVEYDREEWDYNDFEQIDSMDDIKYTERVFVHSSIFTDPESKLLADDAPLAVSIDSNYVIKADDEYSELHDNVYIESSKIETSCFKTKNGDNRLFPPMNNDKYVEIYGTVDGLINNYKKSMVAKQSQKIDKDMKYYITSMRKGQLLENNLLKVLKDKKYYTFGKFRDSDFLSNRNMQKTPDNTTGLLKDLENYLNENSDKFAFINMYSKITKNEPFMMKGADASFFGSYYMKDDGDNKTLIFPYIYVPEDDKYVVYTTANKNFKMMSGAEIMTSFQKKMF